MKITIDAVNNGIFVKFENNKVGINYRVAQRCFPKSQNSFVTQIANQS